MSAAKTAVVSVEKDILSTALLFNKAALGLKEAVAAAFKLDERVLASEEAFNKKATEYATLVDEKKAEILSLDLQIMEQFRVKSLDIDLKLKEYGVSAASTLLANTHAVLTKDAYVVLQNKATEADTTVAKEVAIARAAVKSEYEVKLATQVADSRVASANDTADITALKAQIYFQTAQIKTLEGMISSEREASIERAKAASPTFNIPSAGK